MEHWTRVISSLIGFQKDSHPDKEVREACEEADTTMENHFTAENVREDVYRVYKAIKHNTEGKLSPMEARHLELIMRAYRRTGLDLPKDKRDQLVQLKKEAKELEQKMDHNNHNDITSIDLSLAELAGCSQLFIEGLPVSTADPNKRTVKLITSNWLQISENALSEDVRKRVEHLYHGKAAGNATLLPQWLELQRKIAALLGYKNVSAFHTEILMAENPKNVSQFLADMARHCGDAARSDLALMLKMQEEDCRARNQPFDGKPHLWNWRFYKRMAKEKSVGIDMEKVREYFPSEEVVDGMLRIYERLLRIRFEKVGDKTKNVWHESVSQFLCWDNREGARSDRCALLGTLYLDLWPREGKYSHAACWTLVERLVQPDAYQPCVTAVLANFQPGSNGKPSLLPIDEVDTLFHEIGHALHSLCSDVDSSTFSSVERDFVEAPSQMLEHWVYEEEALSILSGHYLDRSQKLPSDVVKNFKTSREIFGGLTMARQLLFANWDHTVNLEPTGKGLRDLWVETAVNCTGIPWEDLPDSFNSFGHEWGGYAARYYGYLYSEVFAADLFAKFRAEKSIIDSPVGLQYRDIVLAPHRSRPSLESLTRFLGRPPNVDAFVQLKGWNKQKEAPQTPSSNKGASSAPQTPSSGSNPESQPATPSTEEQINMVVAQAMCSRNEAVEALRKNGGNVVNAIMSLSK